jgi:flagellar biosynthesis protein FlhG
MTQSATQRATAPSALLPAALSRTIAVASGKGGVGKTWFSITLGQALAQGGSRVLLFDADLGLANLDVQLGLMPERDLGGVLDGRYGLDAAVVDLGEALFAAAGRSGSGSLAALGDERLDILRRELFTAQSDYDRVILDLGAGIEQTVRFMATMASTCLVLTNDEPTAITDAYAFLKLGYQARPIGDFRIVVNMASSRAQGERTYATLRKACETFLGKTPKLAVVIRRDEKVRDAIRHQVPLLTRHPTSRAAADVERIARGLMES